MFDGSSSKKTNISSTKANYSTNSEFHQHELDHVLRADSVSVILQLFAALQLDPC